MTMYLILLNLRVKVRLYSQKSWSPMNLIQDKKVSSEMSQLFRTS